MTDMHNKRPSSPQHRLPGLGPLPVSQLTDVGVDHICQPLLLSGIEPLAKHVSVDALLQYQLVLRLTVHHHWNLNRRTLQVSRAACTSEATAALFACVETLSRPINMHSFECSNILMTSISQLQVMLRHHKASWQPTCQLFALPPISVPLCLPTARKRHLLLDLP
jgi:hypothetical protein